MSNISALNCHIPSMADEELDIAYKAEELILELPQVDIETTHTIHGGVYTRTVFIPNGVTLVGAEIKVDTTLIFSGYARAFIGAEIYDIDGYNVITAKKKRKQIIHAITDVYLTMILKTDNTTVEDIEDEFTDYSEQLLTRSKSKTKDKQ